MSHCLRLLWKYHRRRRKKEEFACTRPAGFAASKNDRLHSSLKAFIKFLPSTSKQLVEINNRHSATEEGYEYISPIFLNFSFPSYPFIGINNGTIERSTTSLQPDKSNLSISQLCKKSPWFLNIRKDDIQSDPNNPKVIFAI